MSNWNFEKCEDEIERARETMRRRASHGFWMIEKLAILVAIVLLGLRLKDYFEESYFFQAILGLSLIGGMWCWASYATTIFVQKSIFQWFVTDKRNGYVNLNFAMPLQLAAFGLLCLPLWYGVFDGFRENVHENELRQAVFEIRDAILIEPKTER